MEQSFHTCSVLASVGSSLQQGAKQHNPSVPYLFSLGLCGILRTLCGFISPAGCQTAQPFCSLPVQSWPLWYPQNPLWVHLSSRVSNSTTLLFLTCSVLASVVSSEPSVGSSLQQGAKHHNPSVPYLFSLGLCGILRTLCGIISPAGCQTPQPFCSLPVQSWPLWYPQNPLWDHLSSRVPNSTTLLFLTCSVLASVGSSLQQGAKQHNPSVPYLFSLGLCGILRTLCGFISPAGCQTAQPFCSLPVQSWPLWYPQNPLWVHLSSRVSNSTTLLFLTCSVLASYMVSSEPSVGSSLQQGAKQHNPSVPYLFSLGLCGILRTLCGFISPAGCQTAQPFCSLPVQSWPLWYPQNPLWVHLSSRVSNSTTLLFLTCSVLASVVSSEPSVGSSPQQGAKQHNPSVPYLFSLGLCGILRNLCGIISPAGCQTPQPFCSLPVQSWPLWDHLSSRVPNSTTLLFLTCSVLASVGSSLQQGAKQHNPSVPYLFSLGLCGIISPAGCQTAQPFCSLPVQSWPLWDHLSSRVPNSTTLLFLTCSVLASVVSSEPSVGSSLQQGAKHHNPSVPYLFSLGLCGIISPAGCQTAQPFCSLPVQSWPLWDHLSSRVPNSTTLLFLTCSVLASVVSSEPSVGSSLQQGAKHHNPSVPYLFSLGLCGIISPAGCQTAQPFCSLPVQSWPLWYPQNPLWVHLSSRVPNSTTLLFLTCSVLASVGSSLQQGAKQHNPSVPYLFSLGLCGILRTLCGIISPAGCQTPQPFCSLPVQSWPLWDHLSSRVPNSTTLLFLTCSVLASVGSSLQQGAKQHNPSVPYLFSLGLCGILRNLCGFISPAGCQTAQPFCSLPVQSWPLWYPQNPLWVHLSSRVSNSTTLLFLTCSVLASVVSSEPSVGSSLQQGVKQHNPSVPYLFSLGLCGILRTLCGFISPAGCQTAQPFCSLPVQSWPLWYPQNPLWVHLSSRVSNSTTLLFLTCSVLASVVSSEPSVGSSLQQGVKQQNPSVPYLFSLGLCGIISPAGCQTPQPFCSLPVQSWPLWYPQNPLWVHLSSRVSNSTTLLFLTCSVLASVVSSETSVGSSLQQGVKQQNPSVPYLFSLGLCGIISPAGCQTPQPFCSLPVQSWPLWYPQNPLWVHLSSRVSNSTTLLFLTCSVLASVVSSEPSVGSSLFSPEGL